MRGLRRSGIDRSELFITAKLWMADYALPTSSELCGKSTGWEIHVRVQPEKSHVEVRCPECDKRFFDVPGCYPWNVLENTISCGKI
jgi:hypothetical protein